MSCCGVFGVRLRSVVFVGGFRHNSHGVDAGVDVGFSDGARSRGRFLWFQDRIAHDPQINRTCTPGVRRHVGIDPMSRHRIECARTSVPIWSKWTGVVEVDEHRLERTVRAAATASLDEGEFVRRLRRGGVLIRPRLRRGATTLWPGTPLLCDLPLGTSLSGMGVAGSPGTSRCHGCVRGGPTTLRQRRAQSTSGVPRQEPVAIPSGRTRAGRGHTKPTIVEAIHR